MSLLALLPLLVFAMLAAVIWREAMQRSRRLRAADDRPRPLLELAALLVLSLVIVIAVAAVVVAPYSMDAAGMLGCALMPAQIGLLTLASGMLVLAHPEPRGRDFSDGCGVALLWLITFGVGVCYAGLFSGGLGG